MSLSALEGDVSKRVRVRVLPFDVDTKRSEGNVCTVPLMFKNIGLTIYYSSLPSFYWELTAAIFRYTMI